MDSYKKSLSQNGKASKNRKCVAEPARESSNQQAIRPDQREGDNAYILELYAHVSVHRTLDVTPINMQEVENHY